MNGVGLLLLCRAKLPTQPGSFPRCAGLFWGSCPRARPVSRRLSCMLPCMSVRHRRSRSCKRCSSSPRSKSRWSPTSVTTPWLWACTGRPLRRRIDPSIALYYMWTRQCACQVSVRAHASMCACVLVGGLGCRGCVYMGVWLRSNSEAGMGNRVSV